MDLSVIFVIITYIATGLNGSISYQSVADMGAGGEPALGAAITYVSLLFVPAMTKLLFDTKSSSPTTTTGTSLALRHHAAFLGLATLDLTGSFCATTGFLLLGPGLFQVLYSGVIVTNAIVAYIAFGRTVNPGQAVSLVAITLGLSWTTLGSSIRAALGFMSASELTGAMELEGGVVDNVDSGELDMNGLFMTLGATLVYAFSFVGGDEVLRWEKDAPTSNQLSRWLGMYGLGLTALYSLFVVVPRMDETVWAPMEVNDASATVVVALIVWMVLGAAARNASYYALVAAVGAVGAGIMIAVQAVVTFFLSHVLYCASNASQCMTLDKMIATAIVCTGVAGFALTTPSKTLPPPPTPSEHSEASSATSTLPRSAWRRPGGLFSSMGRLFQRAPVVGSRAKQE